MKTVYHLIIAAALTVTSFQTAVAATVYHINKNHQWESIKIDGFARVDGIRSAGKYAWATGNLTSNASDDAVSFYDGEHWSVPQLFPKMTFGSFAIPSYPDTGEKPTGWSYGISTHEPISRGYLDYFDGEKWVAYDEKYSADRESMQYVNIGVVSSTGTLWLIRGAETQNDIVIAKQSDPFNPKVVPLPKDSMFLGKAYADVDGYPYIYLFLATIPTNGWELPTIARLVRYDQDGNAVIIREGIKLENDETNKMQTPYLSVYKNNILMLQWPNVNVFSPDAGKTWISNPPIENYPEEILGTRVCYVDSNKTSINCYDASKPNAQISKLPVKSTYFQYLRDTPHGVWYQSDTDGEDKIIHYNPETSELIDTGVAAYGSNIQYIKPISDTKVIACAYSNPTDYNQVALYYDGTKWLTQSFVAEASCFMYWAGQSGASYTDFDNVWAFDTFGLSDSLIKRKSLLRRTH